MTSLRLKTAIAAALGLATFAGIASSPASAAPSRAELEQSVIQLQESLARAEALLNALEGSGPSSDTVQQQLDSIQSELVRVVGELEEAQFKNARLENELRALRREIQLRDAEIAERLGLEPAFTGTGAFSTDTGGFPPSSGAAASPGATSGFPGPGGATADAGGQTGLGAPGATGATGSQFEPPLGPPSQRGDASTPAETDPGFYGDDPFADARSAAVGTLGAPIEVPDNAPDALEFAKSLLMDGRFGDADTALAQVQDNFGGSPEAAEAMFWRGETQSAAHNYNAAKEFYIDSLQADPSGPRAADAMVALAATLQIMGASSDACDVITEFRSRYADANQPLRQKAGQVRQDAGCR